MKNRPLVCLCSALLLGVTACKTTPAKEEPTVAATGKKPSLAIPDQSADVTFQSFLSRLRQAAAGHDVNTLAELMTTDFGYRMEPPLEGAGVFTYWDENNVWPELSLILHEKFVPKENYMVAPKEFVVDEAHYNGYRAGIQLINGSWKFAYFVSG